MSNGFVTRYLRFDNRAAWLAAREGVWPTITYEENGAAQSYIAYPPDVWVDEIEQPDGVMLINLCTSAALALPAGFAAFEIAPPVFPQRVFAG